MVLDAAFGFPPANQYSYILRFGRYLFQNERPDEFDLFGRCRAAFDVFLFVDDVDLGQIDVWLVDELDRIFYLEEGQ